jgi:hypothetical protein
VLTGFKAGIGLEIVLDQVPKLLGIHITKHGFFFDAVSVVQHLPETSTITLIVALATFAVLIAMERLWPHSPAPLVAVAGGIAAVWFVGLEKMGVSIVGLIPRGGPSPSQSPPGAPSRAPPILRSTRTGNCSPPARRTLSARCSASCQPAEGLRRRRSCAPPGGSHSWLRW